MALHVLGKRRVPWPNDGRVEQREAADRYVVDEMGSRDNPAADVVSDQIG